MLRKKIRNKVTGLNNRIHKKYKLYKILYFGNSSVKINSAFHYDVKDYSKLKIVNVENYTIFGKQISLDNINWHKDYVSEFEYPVLRFDKIKINDFFDKGNDVKYPWEISRFYFGVKLAQNFAISKDIKYYEKFKELVSDWIDKNPFCYGVNWFCTMEVAIRAINWIVSVNIFGTVFEKDDEFKEIISKSLVQHAKYISSFPEISTNGYSSNHLIANYTGLVFLALFLSEHKESNKWFDQSINGLTDCIDRQVYVDGVDFEASIPYHRLVLEMFGYAAIVCRANNIILSDLYYEKLFKMFEYTSAYIDQNGNAPQVGDNDSGRILIFHESDEHDHSYLLELGEQIFDYKFKSQCAKRDTDLLMWLPSISKLKFKDYNITPRNTDKSIFFENGGAYIYKFKDYSLFISCFPPGQNGKGGHKHLDYGSFTLSYKGEQIIVDPGTYTYTRSKNTRDYYRNIRSHNVTVHDNDNITLSTDGFWNLNNYYTCDVIRANKNILELKISRNDLKEITYLRTFYILEKEIVIKDNIIGKMKSYININSKLKTSIKHNKLTFEKVPINIETSGIMSQENCFYSNSYDSQEKSFKIIVKSENHLCMKIKFI